MFVSSLNLGSQGMPWCKSKNIVALVNKGQGLLKFYVKIRVHGQELELE